MSSWNDKTRQRNLHAEVGTRDGLQVEQAFVPTEERSRWSTRCRKPAWAKIEVTAVVSPQADPAQRDAEIVLRQIERKAGRWSTPACCPMCVAPSGDRRAGGADSSTSWMSAARRHNQRQPAHDAASIRSPRCRRWRRWRAAPAWR
jgi:hydroxymethylglutaryl-CoA lyase